MARIGMNSAELGQIEVIGLRGHYGFTTNEEGKNKGVFLTEVARDGLAVEVHTLLTIVR